MSEIEIVRRDGRSVHGLVFVDGQDSVWQTFSKPWWDLASWLWWWLAPGAKRWVLIRGEDGKRVRVLAVRLARRFYRMGSSS